MNRYQIPYVKKTFHKNVTNQKNITNQKIMENKIKNEFKNIEGKIKGLDTSNLQRNIMIGILSLLAIFLLIIIFMLVIYLLTPCHRKKNVLDYLFDFEFDPCIEKEAPRIPPPSYRERFKKDEEEVFHLSNQDYTYEQAKCKCRAYGGKLASKDEMIEVYNKGADWCSYGWSKGQNAFYPTQKCTWDKLQKGPKRHRWDCGLPGINGGFFANPRLKFGINCYGIKPKGRLVKEKRPICTSKEFCKLQPNYEASHKLETDNISSFNLNQWSKYG